MLVKEIHRLSEEEAANVRGWLKASRGRAFVLVHPGLGQEKSAGERDYRSIFFTRSEGDVKPVFLFEERDRLTPEKILRAKEWISSYGEKRWGKTRPREVGMRPVILVPTKKYEPTPSEEDWHAVTDRMRDLGAEELMVFGKYLKEINLKELEETQRAVADEHFFEGMVLGEELERRKQAAVAEKEQREKTLEKLERSLARKGLSPQEIRARMKGMREKIEKMLETGHGGCVGEAYCALLLSKKFKKIHLLKRYSAPF